VAVTEKSIAYWRLATLWTYITMEAADPHWRRVCSAANISDSISRRDFTLAHEHGWTEVQADWNLLYKKLAKCTASLHHALHSHEMLCRATKQGRENMASQSRTTMDGGKPDQHAQTLHPCATDRRHRIQKGVKADAGAALSQRG
jgi:hypothetical protein